MRSYLNASFHGMVLLSLLIGVTLYLLRARWLEIFGSAGPFPALASLYAGLFLCIQQRSLVLMGCGIAWSGLGSPLFQVFLFRAGLIIALLIALKPFLSVHHPLAAVLGSLALCLLVAAFVDNLRLLARVNVRTGVRQDRKLAAGRSHS
jgi:hypothetical protein